MTLKADNIRKENLFPKYEEQFAEMTCDLPILDSGEKQRTQDSRILLNTMLLTMTKREISQNWIKRAIYHAIYGQEKSRFGRFGRHFKKTKLQKDEPYLKKSFVGVTFII